MSKVRFTQHDVARRAEVSQAVVSYVINRTNLASVSEDTRQRVLSAIEELGYVPDGVARGMRTGRSMMIGSVIPDITNPFYPAFQRGVQDVAEAAGFSLLTFNSDGVRDRELSNMRTALQCGVDGLIMSLFQTTTKDLTMIHAHNIPLVIYGSLTDQPLELPYDVLDIDIERATKQIVMYLFQKGHRSIALIGGPDDGARVRPRAAAFREIMTELGVPIDDRLMVQTEYSEAGGHDAMSRILKITPYPTCVIAANDVIAMGVLSRINEAGLSVPDDISVVGNDDIPAARLLRPPLTTVALHPERIGMRAMELLLDRLTGTVSGEGRTEFMPHSLVIRASA